jgi:hypothetical protein
MVSKISVISETQHCLLKLKMAIIFAQILEKFIKINGKM